MSFKFSLSDYYLKIFEDGYDCDTESIELTHEDAIKLYEYLRVNLKAHLLSVKSKQIARAKDELHKLEEELKGLA